MTDRRRLRVCVRGVVQGVGFRPFVYTHRGRARPRPAPCATTARARSSRSRASRGTSTTSCSRLRDQPPPLAVIESIETQRYPGRRRHRLHHRRHIAVRRRPHAGLPRRRDVRRLRGRTARPDQPALPARRSSTAPTAVRGSRSSPRCPTTAPPPRWPHFPMCADCAREYADPADRRFHAQPVCCPRLRADTDATAPATATPTARRDGAARRPARLLRDGGVLAVKGIGGYHLACDAAQRARGRRAARAESAAATSRSRSWCADLTTRTAHRRRRRRVGAAAVRAAAADRAAAPAARARRSPTPSHRTTPTSASCWPTRRCTRCCSGCAGDEPGPDALVMTSGNLGGEPICFTDDDALDRLSHLADGWLMHDRAILVPVRRLGRPGVVDGMPSCRSGAPADTHRCPVALPVPLPPTLAVGADLKNTLAVAEGKYAWLSQHIGDMDDLATLSAFDSAQRHLRALTGVDPEVLVADAHPLLPVDRLGAPQRRRPARPHGAAPPRSHRRGDGRARTGRLASRCSGSPSTEPVTAPTARSGAARCCSPTTRATSGWRT